MAAWQLQEATARFSEVIRKATLEGPQEITVHGHQTAVVLSQKDYIALTRKTVSFVDFMQTSPLMGVEFDLERNPSPNRDVVL